MEIHHEDPKVEKKDGRAFVNFAVICGTTFGLQPANMNFDAQAIFANLTEKERVLGHHSAEGRAIRVLSRALNGWSCGNLSDEDVVVLCDQALDDWLKARLNVSAWSTARATALLAAAIERDRLTPGEADCLQRVHNLKYGSDGHPVGRAEAELALLMAIEIIEKHWA